MNTGCYNGCNSTCTDRHVPPVPSLPWCSLCSEPFRFQLSLFQDMLMLPFNLPVSRSGIYVLLKGAGKPCDCQPLSVPCEAASHRLLIRISSCQQ